MNSLSPANALPEHELVTDRFDVHDFLKERIENDNFTMVEIGHDAVPVAYQQPFDFTDGRLYIGVEAWLRDRCGKEAKLHKEKVAKTMGKNIVFITRDTGAEVQFDFEEGESWLEGGYNAETVLPNEIADEVLMSNVICDPHIAFDERKVVSLLSAAARILKPSGKVVLRETITPTYADLALKRSAGKVLELEPLSTVKLFGRGWPDLEAAYKGDPITTYPYHSASKYHFFQKKN